MKNKNYESTGSHEYPKGAPADSNTKTLKMCLLLSSLRGRCWAPVPVKALFPSLWEGAQAQVDREENEAPS